MPILYKNFERLQHICLMNLVRTNQWLLCWGQDGEHIVRAKGNVTSPLVLKEICLFVCFLLSKRISRVEEKIRIFSVSIEKNFILGSFIWFCDIILHYKIWK